MFYCMFYFTCGRSFSRIYSSVISADSFLRFSSAKNAFSVVRVLKPKFHYADFPETARDTCHGEVSGKSATCHGEVADMDHVTGKSQGCFGVSNHHKYT